MTTEAHQTDFSAQSQPNNGLKGQPAHKDGRRQLTSFRQLSEELFLINEKNHATTLGTLRELEVLRRLPEFAAAQEEWRAGIAICMARKKLTALTSEKPASEMAAKYVLEMLRFDNQEETLRKNAAVIYSAALDGDVSFFEKIALAFRARPRRRSSKTPFALDFSILVYWFAGHLWLMTDDVAVMALSDYLKLVNTPSGVVSEAAYTGARGQLKLRGYRAFTRSAPIIDYNDTKRDHRYCYGPNWTKLVPV